MNGLLLNIVLALIWGAVTGQLTPGNLLFGFGLGFVILFFTRDITGTADYGTRFPRVIRLFLFFLWELVRANLRVAIEVLTPGLQIRPGVVAIPLDVKTDIQIALLANLVTLTPGSISLDISADRSVLYLHSMYVDDPDAVRREIKEGFERRILELFR